MDQERIDLTKQSLGGIATEYDGADWALEYIAELEAQIKALGEAHPIIHDTRLLLDCDNCALNAATARLKAERDEARAECTSERNAQMQADAFTNALSDQYAKALARLEARRILCAEAREERDEMRSTIIGLYVLLDEDLPGWDVNTELGRCLATARDSLRGDKDGMQRYVEKNDAWAAGWLEYQREHAENEALKARVAELEAERAAIEYAAHMPGMVTAQIGDSIWLGEVVEYVVVALAPAVAFCQRRGGLPNAVTPIRLADIGANGLRHAPRKTAVAAPKGE